MYLSQKSCLLFSEVRTLLRTPISQCDFSGCFLFGFHPFFLGCWLRKVQGCNGVALTSVSIMRLLSRITWPGSVPAFPPWLTRKDLGYEQLAGCIQSCWVAADYQLFKGLAIGFQVYPVPRARGMALCWEHLRVASAFPGMSFKWVVHPHQIRMLGQRLWEWLCCWSGFKYKAFQFVFLHLKTFLDRCFVQCVCACIVF